MKRRIILITIMISILTLIMYISAGAETLLSGSCGENITFTLDSTGVLTITGTGEMTGHEWTDPESLKLIKRAVISDGITSIAEGAFSGCLRLENVEIPDSVQSIGKSAFYDCLTLKAVHIPEGITYIDDYTFYSCSSITSITIPDSVTGIGDYAFNYCGLTEAVIPANVKTLGTCAFSECTEMTSVTLPDGLEIIGVGCFTCNTKLKSITLPDNAVIDDWAFDDSVQIYAHIGSKVAKSLCINNWTDYVVFHWKTFRDPRYPVYTLGYVYANRDDQFTDLEIYDADAGTETVVIPDGVTRIANYAFAERQDIKRVISPDSVTSIGVRAFQLCGYIKQFEFPKNLQRIDAYAFQSASFLVNPVLPESLTYIGKGAFYNCYEMINITIPKNVKSIEDETFFESIRLKEITLHEGLKSIGKKAFSYCEKLKEIRIPDSVTAVGDDAFHGCDAVRYANRNSNGAKSISKAIDSAWAGVTEDDYFYSFREPGTKYDMRYLYNGDSITGLAVTGADKTIKSVTLVPEVTAIEERAFCDCNKLESITIPDKVTSIGEKAFGNCSALKKISFMQKKSTSVSIESTAFDGVSSPDAYCYANSSAENYAIRKGWNVIRLDGTGGDTVQRLKLEGDFSIPVGSSRELIVDLFPASAEITWSSTNPQAVSVQNGVVTAKAAGTAFITAKAGGKTDTVTVTAYNPVQSFELELVDEWTIQWNQTTCRVVNKQPSDARMNLEWYSDDEWVATVENGVVSTLKRGDAMIIARDILSGVSAYVTIHVCYPVTNIELHAEPARIVPGQTANLTANVTMRNYNCVNHLVTFSSSNPAIATVNQEGKITGKTPGYVTITATAMPHSSEHPESQASRSILFEVMEVCSVSEGVEYGHDWGETEYVWEDNNTKLRATRTCLRNPQHTETETVDVIQRVTKKPTCTKKGETTYTSAAFRNQAFEAQEKTEADIPETGHDWEETVYEWNSDHTQVTATRICRNNRKHIETETAALAGSEITKEANCTEEGETTYTSAAFENQAFTVQHITIRDIPAKGHKEIIDISAKEPTCTETGTTVGSHCERCGTVLKEAETIPMIPHVKAVDKEAKAPTCCETGWTEASHCANCGTVLSESEEIPMIPHVKVVDKERKDATCTEAGWTEASHCANCGTVLSETEEISMLAHVKVVDKEAKAATCTEAGCTEGAHCANCGTLLSESEVIPMLPHVKTVDKEAKAPTCCETGWTEASHCENCGTVLSESEEIPMVPHVKAVDLEKKDATCTEGGWTEASHCENCGTILSESEEIAALGHQWGTPYYHWAKDCSTCTAEQVCERDTTHVRTEEGTVSCKTTPASETTDGKTVYTAVFTDEAFTKQTKEVIIPKLAPAVSSGEYKDPNGTGFYFIHKEGVATYMRPEKSEKTVIIPDSIRVNGKDIKVTSIWDNAFKNDKNLTTITIGANVTAIGKDTFASCTKLKTVKGGKYAAKIKDGAFSSCKALTKFPVMEKLQTIGMNAFKDCVKLKQFTIGKSVKEIGKSAFLNCKALKSITVKTSKLTANKVKKDAFKGINAKAVFKCPKKKVKDYLKLFVKKGAPKSVKVK